jgi:hypothetical protein
MYYKQNNFRKLPNKLSLKLKTIKDNHIIVGTKITIPVSELYNKYVYLELPSQELLQLNQSIVYLPASSRGQYSKRNIIGKTVTLKNKDKVEKSWAIEGPNYGDYSKGTHTAIISKKVFQKETEFPKNLSIKITPTQINKSEIMFKFEINKILDKNSDYFKDDLLFFINLLQENVKDIDVFPLDKEEDDNLQKETEFVDWELLPFGTKDILNLISKKINKSDVNKKQTTDRIKFFSNQKLPIDHYISGTGSFDRYFGMYLKNEIVILEDFNYGNATYVFNQNWKKFSKMSRTDLMHLKSNEIERIIHNNNWSTRLNYIINSSNQN